MIEDQIKELITKIEKETGKMVKGIIIKWAGFGHGKDSDQYNPKIIVIDVETSTEYSTY